MIDISKLRSASLLMTAAMEKLDISANVCEGCNRVQFKNLSEMHAKEEFAAIIHRLDKWIGIAEKAEREKSK